jgi:DNA-3-methyladenine glycosylase I
MVAYHDTEWGVPVHDDRTLFEFLALEGAQAGLNWELILKRRKGFRKAFHNFEPDKVARLTTNDVRRLLADPSIIRNRAKILATIENAKRFRQIQKGFGSFDSYVWRFVRGKPIQHAWNSLSECPATTREADALSKDLRARGFRFVGPPICYAFMQAVGMVNDHLLGCVRYDEISKLGGRAS